MTPGTGSQQYEGNRSQWRFVVKVLVIGGTGLIGSKVVVDAAAVARTAISQTAGGIRFEDRLIDNAPAPVR